MESTASSPRGAKRSRTRRSSEEEGGTLSEVNLQESFCLLQEQLSVVIPKLLVQKGRYILLFKVVVTSQVLCGFRVPLQWFLHEQ